LLHGLDWETTGRIASLLGAIKIEHHGTQNHRFTRPEFDARFREAFGRAL
ncbi:MAG: carbohydrate kinase family protein, partial [Gammaproteobacteria bacterium]